MQISASQANKRAGFTLVEVLIAVTVCVIFALSVYATNERLLLSLKAQKETTAATMMLQERMEAFRSLPYANVGNNVASGQTQNPVTMTAADIAGAATTSEAQLGGITGSLQETITVSGYMDTSGNVPPTVAAQNQWIRNSSQTTGSLQSPSSSTLATSYNLLKVDIQITWTSTNGRSRTRDLSGVFGKGNDG